ncbi:MAG TPA: ATP-binding protein [Candidatus Limnocylindria bacterium]|nr:ATP-binding protein [Candidatus Limnocylindria bacterium]
MGARYPGMRGEAVFVLDLERAALRLRLAATALATTLVLLAGEPASTLAAATIPLFLAGAVVLRYGARGNMPQARALAGSALDVVAATAIVFALPPAAPAWILYGFAVANAALWRGPLGVFGATAASILAYDVTLAFRGGEVPATSLWVVQALIAIGLISAELVYSSVRATADRERMRRHGHALRAFAEARGSAALLDTLRAQILALGAVHVRIGGDETALKESLGGRPGFVERLPTREPRYIAVILPADVANPQLETIAHDLIADIAPLVASNERAEHAERLRDATARALDALAETPRETTEAGTLAALTVAAAAVAGRAAIVRLADGVILTGDLPKDPAIELARGGGAAALLVGRNTHWSRPVLAKLDARSAIVVTAGQGRGLIALSSDRVLSEPEFALVQRLAHVAGAVADLVRERDRQRGDAQQLRVESERLGVVLQAREDAVAMAAHELRNPLTSVHGYATLISRNLGAVQDQLTRLDRIIADLLGRTALEKDVADVVKVATEAVGRLRALTGRDAWLVEPDQPALARIDPVRLAQVFDNLLRNAAKYSPETGAITLQITPGEDEVRFVVQDEGAGIAPDEFEHVFERGFRSPRLAGRTQGEGLGLAVCRQIVEGQGGHISVESAGIDRGSSFTVTLPTVRIAIPSGGGEATASQP